MLMTSERPFNMRKQEGHHPAYRPDIDGLRAVAVLAIVIFHAFPSLLPGGYIGVDIFFVISGYLISSILFLQLNNSAFGFVSFYSRRVRRIFPALIVVLLCSLIAGWFVLLAQEYAMLGKHVAGGAGFIANFLYWTESDYFDEAADTKPLLHLWSLGVEEQFYILWPLLLWWVWKKRHNTFLVIALVAGISFSLNIVSMYIDATAMFYLPHSRFWQLLAGALLAYSSLYGFRGLNIPVGRMALFFSDGELSRNYRSIGGALFLAGSLAIITQDKIFPGWWAILPVLGAILIISAGPQAIVNKWLLSSPIFVWLGLISYPLYLWHWPLLTFARILQSDTPSASTRTFMVALSIVLAWLTTKYIEAPIRFTKKSSKVIPLILTGAMVGVCALGIVCNTLDGFGGRAVVLENPDIDSQWDGRDRGMLARGCGLPSPSESKLFASCVHDSRGAARFALLGDSKAAAIFPGLVRTSHDKGRWLFIGGHGRQGSPLPVLSNEELYRKYQNLTRIAIDSLTKNETIETVVLVMAARSLFDVRSDKTLEGLPESPHYDIAFNGLLAAVAKFVDSGKKVVLVIDNPTLPPPKDCIERRSSLEFINQLLLDEGNSRCRMSLEYHLDLAAQYRQLLAEVASRFPGKVSVFDTIQYLCDMEEEICRSHKNGRLLYSYSDHISDYAAGLIGRDLNSYLNENKR